MATRMGRGSDIAWLLGGTTQAPYQRISCVT